MMVPVPYSREKPKDTHEYQRLNAASVVMWCVPFGFTFVAGALLVLARVVCPWAREDVNAYLRKLATMHEAALTRVVEYRSACIAGSGDSRQRARKDADKRNRTVHSETVEAKQAIGGPQSPPGWPDGYPDSSAVHDRLAERRGAHMGQSGAAAYRTYGSGREADPLPRRGTGRATPPGVPGSYASSFNFGDQKNRHGGHN